MVTPADPTRALSHPLPAGMRDLLPEEARRRRALARLVLDHFALHGYKLVTPPAFELASVLERGLGALDPSDVLRFVEPESGEIAALRPDMTPQIARMVATRLARNPRPIRLCYEGTIVRRRQGRARRHRQIPQAGVELYGGPAAGASTSVAYAEEVEILRLAVSVVRAVGLADFALDLGHASIARSLLDTLPPALAAEMGDALENKDTARMAALTANGAMHTATARALQALPDLHGGGPGDDSADAVFRRAEPLLAGTPASQPLRDLHALWEAARAGGDDLARVLRVDLGEVRGFAYYTGAIFHLLAAGPGEPIGAGGRYDDLLARFDAPMPAIGFALNLDAIAWAREEAGKCDPPPGSAVVAAGGDSERIVSALRMRGFAAVAHESGGAADYARAWHYTHVVHAGDGGAGLVLSRVDSEGVHPEVRVDSAAHLAEMIAGGFVLRESGVAPESGAVSSRPTPETA